MTRTFHGSCHGGAVPYEADIDLAAGSGRCNCSICTKTRHGGITVKPEAFRLLTGADVLSDYQFNTRSASPVLPALRRPFGRGRVEAIGGDYVSINLACLDDIEPQALLDVPLRFSDGRHDDWRSAPAETRHP